MNKIINNFLLEVLDDLDTVVEDGLNKVFEQWSDVFASVRKTLADQAVEPEPAAKPVDDMTRAELIHELDDYTASHSWFYGDDQLRTFVANRRKNQQ